MNIALVAPAIAREGITKQIANQIIGLQRHGVNVSLIVLAQADLEILKEYGVTSSELTTLELKQTDAYLSIRAFIKVAGIIKPIKEFLLRQKTDCVIAHGPYAHFVMRFVKLSASISSNHFKLIQYFHGLQYSEYPLTTWKRKAVHGLNSWLASSYDNTHISVSENVKQEIAGHFSRQHPHIVLHNAVGIVDTGSFVLETRIQQMLARDRGKFKMLLPNRIDYNKGQLFFLDVLVSFLNSGQASAGDMAVYLAGDGPHRDEVQQAVDKHKLGQIVSLTGALPNDVVLQLMQRVSLVVVPSFKEGFSFAALEALQAGALVLASDAGGTKEVIKDGKTGFLFKAGDADACLEKLSYIYANKDKVLIDPEAVRQDLENRFSLETYTQQLLQVIKEG